MNHLRICAFRQKKKEAGLATGLSFVSLGYSSSIWLYIRLSWIS